MNFRSRGSPGRPGQPAGPPVRPWLRPLGAAATGIVAFAAVAVAGAGIGSDYLWFHAAGYTGVFSITYGVKWAMFGITGGFVALTIGLNAALARRLRPPQTAVAAGADMDRYRLALDRCWARILTAVLAVIGVICGLAGAGAWRTWLQFAGRTSFGTRDPQFHLDISFFVFVYPFLRLVLGFLFVAVVLSLVAAAVVHFVYGGLRFRPGDPQTTAAARAHLFILLEQFIVKPNEIAKESRYLQREIDGTRSAYGVAGVRVTSYPSRSSASPRQLVGEVAALPDLRLMDPPVVSRTFQQLQQVKSFYRFAGVLSVDRYQLPGAATPQDVVIGVREMAGPPAGQASWVNTHLVYTHGFGVVAASAGSAQANGAPSFVESDIPPDGALGSFQPRVYFGLQEPSYAIVGGRPGSAPAEFDYPAAASSGQRQTTYHGGGVPIGSMTSRLLYAIKFGEPNILLSSAVNRSSRLLYVRDPLARVAKVAPFLTLDGDVYPVVADGRILWVADGYTTTDAYPYSARYDVGSATQRPAAPAGPGAGQVNYIRNSVKAVVDAYTGQVTLYQWDTGDPVLRTWMKVFPGLVKPRAALPASLLAHLRYPQDLFDIQREVLATYHVQAASAFYVGQNFWDVPGDPSGAAPGAGPQPPAYLTTAMPGAQGPEFSLVTSFTQQGRPDMAAYMAVDSNPASPGYGTIRLLVLPQDAATPGPQQVQNTFESDPPASAELTALRRGASKVILGDLIALPVGTGFLYVEPMYVEASAVNNAGAYPTLQAVLASYGGSIGFGKTLPDALGQVFTGLASSGASSGGTATGAAGGGNAAVRSDIAQAERSFTAAQTALKTGDFAAYGQDIAAMKRALDAAQQQAAAKK